MRNFKQMLADLKLPESLMLVKMWGAGGSGWARGAAASGGGEGVSGAPPVVGTTWSSPAGGGEPPVSSSLDSQLHRRNR